MCSPSTCVKCTRTACGRSRTAWARLAAGAGDLKQRFSYEIDTRGFDISAMGRLFAAEVLPETVEKAPFTWTVTPSSAAAFRLFYETKLSDALVGDGDGAHGVRPDEGFHRHGAGRRLL